MRVGLIRLGLRKGSLHLAVARLSGAAAPETFAQKLDLLTNGNSKKSDWADVWSRGSIMQLSFRVAVLNDLCARQDLGCADKTFPNLSDFKGKNKRRDEDEQQWLEVLQDDPEFNRAYAAVPWEGREWKKAILGSFLDPALPAAAISGTISP